MAERVVSGYGCCIPACTSGSRRASPLCRAHYTEYGQEKPWPRWLRELANARERECYAQDRDSRMTTSLEYMNDSGSVRRFEHADRSQYYTDKQYLQAAEQGDTIYFVGPLAGRSAVPLRKVPTRRMTTKPIEMVAAFHAKYDSYVHKPGTPLPQHEVELGAAFLKEEYHEFEDVANRWLVAGMPQDPESLAPLVHELVDLQYVLSGMFLRLGLDPDPLFREVHAANMRKQRGVKNLKGKVLKGHGWKPAALAPLLAAQLGVEVIER